MDNVSALLECRLLWGGGDCGLLNSIYWFRFFCTILWENLNELSGQPNTLFKKLFKSFNWWGNAGLCCQMYWFFFKEIRNVYIYMKLPNCSMLATKSHQKYPCWLIKTFVGEIWAITCTYQSPYLEFDLPSLLISSTWQTYYPGSVVGCSKNWLWVLLPRRVHHCLLSATPVLCARVSSICSAGVL